MQNHRPTTTGIRDAAAIVGVGRTEFSKNSGVSTLALALRAISTAVSDAGLALTDIDGFVTHSVGDAVPASAVSHSVGNSDPRLIVDLVGGGGVSMSTIGSAAAAIATGQAEVVVCWRALNARSEFRMGGTGRAAPTLVEFQYQTPYGLVAPPQQYAIVASRYMALTGTTSEDLGAVAVAQREYAAANPRAVMRDPLDMDTYLSSRMISDPLRLYDCCLETDGAVAVVLTSTERAHDLAKPPVLVSATAMGGGHSFFGNGPTDYSISGAHAMAPRLFDAAGFGPDELSVAEIYDAFTPLVLMQLEDYGIVARGGAGAFVRDGQTRIDGLLPVNTHGGHLSEGYVHGLNHVAEAVDQLRGHASPERQVAGAQTALCTGQPGYVSGVTSAVLLRRN